mmetsp:Transcript_8118/g.10269  ORF Transcript_8118/g.10269 Transcript_8118/m.10269 type:complete len:128 (+) Transcript_8118:184-567(+)
MGEQVHVPKELTQLEVQTMSQTEAVAGDEEFLLTILGMVRNSLEEKLVTLKTSIETEDTMSVWKIAHTIKGTALQCGLDRLAFASENLERAFRQPEGDDMTKRSLYYQTFVNESERVIGTARKLGAQ